MPAGGDVLSGGCRKLDPCDKGIGSREEESLGGSKIRQWCFDIPLIYGMALSSMELPILVPGSRPSATFPLLARSRWHGHTALTIRFSLTFASLLESIAMPFRRRALM